MEAELFASLLAAANKVGPIGVFALGAGWLFWKLNGTINQLKESAVQTALTDQAKRITLVESKLNAVEIALVKIGAWNQDSKHSGAHPA